ncbi:MAG: glucose-6-phosphate isomerase [Bacteroidales bacterium]|nr:glucose-6-phosphate isomerase [Bacteroidales bacterium]
MKDIELDYSNCLDFINEKDILKAAETGLNHLNLLKSKSGKGSDFLGWLTLPDEVMSETEKIEEVAQKLRKSADISVVIGIGGSYLGAKSVIDVFTNPFENGKINGHQILFAGHHMGEDYLSDMLNYLSGVSFNIIVISKSGTTTEPAIAFRLLKKLLEENIGKKEAVDHIIAITDKSRGALRTLSEEEGYETFVIPDDIGGRFSVLTPVGLLPIACARIDIRQFISGAAKMASITRDNTKVAENPALIYAAIRNLLLRKKFNIEMLVNYNPRLHFIAEWWKQLFGESEGKDGKGIFPASADLTTDLHSLGQYIQDGQRIIFETVLSIDNCDKSLVIPEDKRNLDKLNFIAAKRISYVNKKAEEGTMMAHVNGGVPVIKIVLPVINEHILGQLLYLFEISCAVSGYELGVNPFDQPGVEAYKTNMFRLLGKEGY